MNAKAIALINDAGAGRAGERAGGLKGANRRFATGRRFRSAAKWILFC